MSKIDFSKYPYLENIGGVPSEPDDGMEDLSTRGWGALLTEMFDSLNTVFDEYGVPRSIFSIQQIKEKFGSLRVYYCLDFNGTSLSNDAETALSHRVMDIVDDAGARSEKLCCVCGAPASYLSTGWVVPYCEKCARRNHEITEARCHRKFDFEKSWQKISE